MAALSEGWYLMSIRDLEIELARARGEARTEPSGARSLTIDEALAYKAAGNVPDAEGRSLRLVLHVVNDADAARLHERRLLWEPDFHDPPSWRRSGSVPVNIVPLRTSAAATRPFGERWQDDPQLAALESAWRTDGTIAGVRVPGAYRGFVYKTVLALQAAGRAVTVDSIVGSVERWLGPRDVLALREALEAANG